MPKLDVLGDVHDFQLLPPNWGIASVMKRVAEKGEGLPPAFFLLL